MDKTFIAITFLIIGIFAGKCFYKKDIQEQCDVGNYFSVYDTYYGCYKLLQDRE